MAGPVDWTPEMEAKLGKGTDKMIAEEYGLTNSAVYRHRTKLKIPRYDGGRDRGPREEVTSGEENNQQ